jgi:S-adenosylmethionine:tRNA ribosyltransferase-isomerase
VMVRNNTKVMPARLFGTKETGGQVEVLLVKKLGHSPTSETWECLTKPGLKPGQTLSFGESQLQAECQKITDYTREITFNQTGVEFLQTLDQLGEMPLPPYIEWDKSDPRQLKELYQTTYAQVFGSVAAPTAGLHFTPELDDRLRVKGIGIFEVTLHVGLGTFLPVKTQEIAEHHMHSEWYELSAETAQQLNQARATGKKILAIGTTTCRVLETRADKDGKLIPGTGETQIFIYPPYQFKTVDSLITNFHLPESTLLMLISALVSAPNTAYNFINFAKSLMGRAYQNAIDQKYRFFSFGDAMWIK